MSDPTILYIAGIGRSGSTLLDAMLDSHPELFGAGELTHVFEEIAHDARCSCGNSYSRCDFWQEVLRGLAHRSATRDPRWLADLTRPAESLASLAPPPATAGAGENC